MLDINCAGHGARPYLSIPLSFEPTSTDCDLSIVILAVLNRRDQIDMLWLHARTAKNK